MCRRRLHIDDMTTGSDADGGTTSSGRPAGPRAMQERELLLTFCLDKLDTLAALAASMDDESANRRPDRPGADSPVALLVHCCAIARRWSSSVNLGGDPAGHCRRRVLHGPVGGTAALRTIPTLPQAVVRGEPDLAQHTAQLRLGARQELTSLAGRPRGQRGCVPAGTADVDVDVMHQHGARWQR